MAEEIGRENGLQRETRGIDLSSSLPITLITLFSSINPVNDIISVSDTFVEGTKDRETRTKDREREDKNQRPRERERQEPTERERDKRPRERERQEPKIERERERQVTLNITRRVVC